jgi:parallel beta-helix repeat protein
MRRTSFLLLASVGLLGAFGSAKPAHAAAIVVTTTIQAAVDAARPGDTIKVPPGTYRENVLVTKDRISIEAAAGAVLDGAGLPGGTGILVEPAGIASAVHGFKLSGLRVQNYMENGILILHGDGFRVSHGRYVQNGQYGIFARLSQDGLIEDNRVSGSDDTGIYVGQSDGIRVEDNSSEDCTVGIEVENSSRVRVEGNRAAGNSVGILVDVLPGLEITATTAITVRENVLDRNNRPNPVTDPEDILALLPSGIGLLNVGGDAMLAEGNVVTRNESGGIVVVQLPPDAAALDPRIDPFPDQNSVRHNVALRNGGHPDPKLLAIGLPGADLIWDFSGTDDCWTQNTFQTVFPGPLPACR